MDRTDLRIFSLLVANPFRSDEGLGREVQLTGKAVRLRRKRLEADGVLTEYAVHPRAETLGRHELAWGYTATDGREPLPSRLREIDDLVYVRRFRPDFCMVVRFTKEPDAPDDPRLAGIFGRPFAGPLYERPPWNSVEAEGPSRVDWKVLEAVVRSPRASLSLQAEYAGVSPKTIRVRRAKLEETHVLESSMILNLEREGGLSTYGIWLKVDASFNEEGLKLPRLWDSPHWTENPRGVYLLGSADSYFEARELELRLRSLPGVTSADPLIPAGGYFARERVLDWIRTERGRRFGAVDARP